MSPKKRRGGPNPGAVPRKILKGTTSQSVLKASMAARDGDFQFESLSSALDLLGCIQFRKRADFKREVPPCPCPDMVPASIADRILYEFAERNVQQAQDRLFQWLAADGLDRIPDRLRELARIFEARPVRKPPGRSLELTPADPTAHAVLFAASVQPMVNFKKGTQFPASNQEVVEAFARSSKAERDDLISRNLENPKEEQVRKVIRDLLEVKGKPGRPKAKRKS